MKEARALIWMAAFLAACAVVAVLGAILNESL